MGVIALLYGVEITRIVEKINAGKTRLYAVSVNDTRIVIGFEKLSSGSNCGNYSGIGGHVILTEDESPGC
jgi:hypothetical protein